MARDIDYAAVAVKNSLVEKFARQNQLEDLEVIANERTISVRQAGRVVEGTRDDLLAAIRKANIYDDFWQVLPGSGLK